MGKKRKEIKSGLVFPVAKVEKLIRENTKQKLSSGVSVFMTAVIEYLCAEILELSGNVSRDLRTIRITPRNMFFAVDTDDELSKLLEKLKFKFTGGVMPHIHSSLFYEKSKKSKKNIRQKMIFINLKIYLEYKMEYYYIITIIMWDFNHIMYFMENMFKRRVDGLLRLKEIN